LTLHEEVKPSELVTIGGRIDLNQKAETYFLAQCGRNVAKFRSPARLSG
jgi:hypothetical protein